MKIPFHKYQGTGNDFILIDNRSGDLSLSKEQVAFLCDRHFGIGADGLMLLQLTEEFDFLMVYYNADGNESTMCGNGGRCIVRFASEVGIVFNKADFLAVDGPHKGEISEDGIVSLGMKDVSSINRNEDHLQIDTGSPHYITWVDDVAAADVFNEGKRIRNLQPFQPDGINVNFVERVSEGIKVRTYERGVEDETLSCGTGVTAAAIASSENKTGKFSIPVFTPGGRLEVSFEKPDENTAINVILKGPAVKVFSGEIIL
jgi:diaminopimelate epimerase